MLSYIWPIALVVVSNTVYQICAKSVPDAVHPLAALTVTYLISALVSAGLYYALNRGGSLIREYGQLNWAPFVLGLVIVGLEVGLIYAYKVGWAVSTASTVQSSILAVALVFVGGALYHEQVTPSKIIGIVLCMFGVWFISK